MKSRLILRPYVYIIGFVSVWVLAMMITSHNLPLDVLENLAWGQLWQWGYYKHPPLMAWQQEAVFLLFGRQDWPAYLLSFSYIGCTFYFLYKIAKQADLPSWLYSLTPALIASIYYYTVQGKEFNANIAIFPLWMAYIYYFVSACETNKIRSWVLVGIIAALGMMGKYSFGILLFSSLPAVLFIPRYRKLLYGIGPYLSVSLMLFLLTPHIIWLFQHNFPTIKYLYSSLEKNQSSLIRQFLDPMIFFLLMMLLSLSIFPFLLIVARPTIKKIYNDRQKIILILAITPLFITMIVDLLSVGGLDSYWGYPLPAALSLIWLIGFDWTARHNIEKRAAIVSFITLFAPSLIFIFSILVAPYIRDKGKSIEYDGHAFAQMAQSYWYEQTGSHTLPAMIAGDYWAADNISWYSKERPKVVVVDRKHKKNTWLKFPDMPEKLLWVSRDDLRNIPRYQHPQSVLFPWYKNRYSYKSHFSFAVISKEDLIDKVLTNKP